MPNENVHECDLPQKTPERREISELTTLRVQVDEDALHRRNALINPVEGSARENSSL